MAPSPGRFWSVPRTTRHCGCNPAHAASLLEVNMWIQKWIQEKYPRANCGWSTWLAAHTLFNIISNCLSTFLLILKRIFPQLRLLYSFHTLWVPGYHNMDTVQELNSACFESDMQESTVSNVIFPRTGIQGDFFSFPLVIWWPKLRKLFSFILV